jgi:hypothetical protein
MIHPLHGAMHAYGLGEIATLEKLGWAVEKPPEAKLATPPDTHIEVTPLPAQAILGAEIAKRKPGRPPKAK